jgi:NhaP-type Na+/H+ or K+/H+ antiporter
VGDHAFGFVINVSIHRILPGGSPFSERDLVLVVVALVLLGQALLLGLTLHVVVGRAGLNDAQKQDREEEAPRWTIETANVPHREEYANGFGLARQAILHLQEQNQSRGEVFISLPRDTMSPREPCRTEPCEVPDHRTL